VAAVRFVPAPPTCAETHPESGRRCERDLGHPMDEWKHYYTKWTEPASPSEEPDVFPVLWE
jgi:hypothetical protein